MINNKVDVKNLYSKKIQKLSVMADPILFGPLLVLFFYNLNQFALIPYLGLISENNASLITASIVGLALTSKSVAEKLSLFGISVLNLNYKKTTILTFGLFIRAICFFIINLYFNPIILIASVAIIGVAGSMIRPTVRSILNDNPNTNIKDKVFSLMFLFSNLGGIIGPLLVSLNLNIWFKNNLLACLAILDLLLALLVINVLSKEEKNADDKMVSIEQKENPSIFQNITSVYLSNRNLINIYLLHMSFWITVSLCIMLVSFLNKISPELSSYRGYIFGIEGVVVVIVQVLLMKKYWTDRLLSKTFASLSVFILFLGVFLLMYGNSLFVFLSAGVLIGVSEGILGPYIYNSFSKSLKSVDVQKAFSALLLFELFGDMIGYSVSGFILSSVQINYNFANLFGIAVLIIMFMSVLRIKNEP